jgi:hypothetical protein
VAHIEFEGLESWYAADGNVVGAGPLTDEEALLTWMERALHMQQEVMKC